jgi:PAS domain S-box-containing protein
MTLAFRPTELGEPQRDGELPHSQTLLRISDALRALSDPDAIMFIACGILGESLGASRVYYATVVDDAVVVISRDFVNGVASAAGRHPVEVFGPDLTAAFRRGEDVVIDDVATDRRLSEAGRRVYAAKAIASSLSTGLLEGGRWVGALSVQSTTRRVWNSAEVALVREVGARTWAALERARAEVAHREREERYAALFQQSPIATALTRLSDRVFVDVNSAFLLLFEVERHELIGKTTVELGISLEGERIEHELGETGRPLEFECTRTTKSGAKRILLLDVVPVTAGGERYVLTKVRDITEQRHAEDVERLYEQSRERLLDLDMMERLHRVSTRFFGEEGLPGVLDEIVETAIAVTQADFGNIQVLDPRSGQLEIVVARGLPDWWTEYWNRVAKGRGSCGMALERAERVIVEDVAQSSIFTTSEALEIQLRAGVRACQSTPVFDRSGVALGMISTHYRTPQRPSDHALRLLDLLARQAADILDRARRDAEERRREIEQRLLANVGGAVSTMDYESALASVTRVFAESIADFAVIYLVDEGERIRRTTAASRDREHDALLDIVLAQASQPRPTHPVWEVIATRRPLIATFDPADYERMAESPAHLAALRSARPRNALVIPMIIGDSCVGAIGLTSSTRQFDERDTALVVEIGRRCALVVENARLHAREQRAIRARSDVLGIVAHDLRNPLNSIALNALILQQQATDVESVESIRRSATRMTRIIQDLLDVARFEAGMLGVERARVPAAYLVAEAARAHRKSVAVSGLELRQAAVQDLPLVWADTERVAQVFENLVSNAMKFTASGAITIGAESNGGDVVFSVADTGCGIEAANLARIFDPFWQARHDKREGAGLGLSIVKTIVETHGGRAWATSDVGTGSTFYFTLPAASPPETAAPRGDEGSTDAANPRVLIIDDDADLRRALALTLRQHGYITVTAANGREGLDHLRRGERPTMIVLDLAMPVLDGWAFLDERNRDPILCSIPVIVISGQRDQSQRAATMNAALLEKPVSPDDLVAAMQRAVRS